MCRGQDGRGEGGEQREESEERQEDMRQEGELREQVEEEENLMLELLQERRMKDRSCLLGIESELVLRLWPPDRIVMGLRVCRLLRSQLLKAPLVVLTARQARDGKR